MATNEETFEAVLEKIRLVRNFDFRNYKRATLRRRIERRVTERKCPSVVDYLALLDREPEEFDALIASMLIKVTSFLRDGELWDALRERILPELIERKQPGDTIRIWCAGCATGEEAYSIAMLLADLLGPTVDAYAVKIFGTDVDPDTVSYARRGTYTPHQVEGLPAEIVGRWFLPVGRSHTIRQELRRMVVFGVNNLVSDAPISRLDLLICRNVFIYHDANLQKRVLSRFHYALRQGGYLVLGKSELIPYAARLFEPVDLARRIYRKDPRVETASVLEARTSAPPPVAQATDGGGSAIARAQFHRDVLQSFSSPIIATEPDGTVTLCNRAAEQLWNRSEGELVGKRLNALGLPGLSGDLLVEKTKSVRDRQADREVADGVIVREGMPPLLLSTSVTAIRGVRVGVSGLLYQVHDVTSLRHLETDLRRVNEELRSANEELQTANEELQSSNEELETTNEELQSANEELQTTNEELQSTNEELETTNEELQSTNAELDATNRELAHRTEELNLLELYQRTVIRSLSGAVIVVDPTGRITVWNLAAERLLGLPETEALSQTLWTLRVPAIKGSLIARIRRSLGRRLALRLEDVTYELPGGGRGRATVAAVPLMATEAYLGAVVIIEDTTRVAALAEENRQLREGRPGVSPSRRDGVRLEGDGAPARGARDGGRRPRDKRKTPAR